jgi:hypothetical protein
MVTTPIAAEPEEEAVNPWAGERTITEFWSIGGSNLSHEAAGRLPFGLGVLIYFPVYLLNAALVLAHIRYTLTNRRIRVERGVTKKVVQSIALEDIDDLVVTRDESFTRTGDIDVVSGGQVILTMNAVQSPWPTRQTMLDAIVSRKELSAIFKQQEAARAKAGK